jgi:hypothetical protein
MIDERCPICRGPYLTNPDERSMRACRKCAATIGLIPMPPPRRPNRPCRQCNHTQILRVIPREHSSHKGQISAPMMLTHPPTTDDGSTIASPIEIRKGWGGLEAYVCRKCGAVEWYCIDADQIPVHPHLMTELIDVDGDDPYR